MDIEKQLPIFVNLANGAVSAIVAGRSHLTSAMQAHQAETWAKLTSSRPDLYNGQTCRLRQIKVSTGSLHLEMERSSFAHYLATRDGSFRSLFPNEQRGDPLGLTAMVLTADDRIIATTRSATAEQNPNGLYFVGGFCEPPEADGPVDVFAEIRREMAEEIGLSVTSENIRLLGVGYDPQFAHPEAFFLVRYDGDFEQARSRWPAAPDALEASRLTGFRLDELLDETFLLPPHATWSFASGVGCLREAMKAHR